MSANNTQIARTDGGELDSAIVDMALIALQARVEADATRLEALESPADRKRRQLARIFERMTTEPNAPATTVSLPAATPSIADLLAQARAEVDAQKRIGER